MSVLVIGNDEEMGARDDSRENDKCMTRDSGEGVNPRPAVTVRYRERLDPGRMDGFNYKVDNICVPRSDGGREEGRKGRAVQS